MDDPFAMRDLARWLDGDESLTQVLFGNRNWLYHRTVAMGSLALNAWFGGDSAFSLKLGNLVVHLACGAAAFGMVTTLSDLLDGDRQRARVLGTLVAAVWLLHPFNVSTVLYVIQRMAQLSALFCILSVWLYCHLRLRMAAGNLRGAWPTLFVALPLLTLLGIASKQNAAIIPLLCFAVELAIQSTSRRGWPAPIKAFHATFVVVPAILGITLLILRPQTVLHGYSDFGMTAAQRLWSQGPVLVDYIRMILVPYPPAMGIYTDDYPISETFFSPDTLTAWLVLGTVSILAACIRKRLPGVLAGWLLFLTGHAVESSILPLELYYEHRNYFPAFGLIFAVALLAQGALRKLGDMGIHPGRIAWIAIGGVVTVLAIQTAGRVHVWRDYQTLTTAAVETHPFSIRANFSYMEMLLRSGRVGEAYENIERMLASEQARIHGPALLYRLNMDCGLRGSANPDDLQRVVELQLRYVELPLSHAFNALSDRLIEKPCGRLEPLVVAEAMRRIADPARLTADDGESSMYLHYQAARLFGLGGDWARAASEAELAWRRPSSPPIFATVVVQAALARGDIAAAEEAHRDASMRAKGYNLVDKQGLEILRKGIDQYRARQTRRPDG